MENQSPSGYPESTLARDPRFGFAIPARPASELSRAVNALPAHLWPSSIATICQSLPVDNLRALGEAARRAMSVMTRLALESDALLRKAGIQPSIRYKLAGSPYGRNSKGQKRWMLEQSRRRRGLPV